MTPRQARIILSAIESLASPRACQPYIDTIWSDEEEAKLPFKPQYEDPVDEALASYANLRKEYAWPISEKMRELQDHLQGPNKRVFLDLEEFQVLELACKKKGLLLNDHVTMVGPPPVALHSVEEREGEDLQSLFARLREENLPALALSGHLNKQRPKAPIEGFLDAPGEFTIDMQMIQALASQQKGKQDAGWSK